jgi:uncharacterized membrane protein
MTTAGMPIHHRRITIMAIITVTTTIIMIIVGMATITRTIIARRQNTINSL